MDLVTRKTGRHIETEPDYEGAFTLQIRMMAVYALVFDWCFSDVSKLCVSNTTDGRDSLVTISTQNLSYGRYQSNTACAS